MSKKKEEIEEVEEPKEEYVDKETFTQIVSLLKERIDNLEQGVTQTLQQLNETINQVIGSKEETTGEGKKASGNTELVLGIAQLIAQIVTVALQRGGKKEPSPLEQIGYMAIKEFFKVQMRKKLAES
jgi:hypothetical protein